MTSVEHPWSCAVLQELPACLEPQHAHQLLKTSYQEDEQMPLYEHLIRIYGELPYLMVRLGRLQFIRGASTLAVKTLRNALRTLSDMGEADAVLHQFILNCHIAAEHEAQMSRLASSIVFRQAWKMTKAHTFPQLPIPPNSAITIKDCWHSLTPHDSDFFDKYLRSLSVETNHIEETFLLAHQSTQDLMRRGIAEATISYLPQSKIRNSRMIKSILNDTLAAYHEMQSVIQNPELLSLEVICKIHSLLMRTCQYAEEGVYIPGGRTRQETRKAVIVRGGTSGDIQCCSFEKVDQEINYICLMAKQWIKNWRNPFAVASWLHLVLVRCHPFEDGNGRLARLIASIPLIKAGYPPVSISATQREQLFQAINMAYTGDHVPMIDCIVEGMHATINSVRNLKVEPV